MFLEALTIESQSSDEISARETLGRLTGEVIKTVRDSIRQGFLDWSPRLLLAMYSCEIQASSKLQIFSPFLRSDHRFLLCSSFFRFNMKHRSLTITTLEISRSSWARLRCYYPPPRSHHHRAPEGRHSIFHSAVYPSSCRVIWLQRRD